MINPRCAVDALLSRTIRFGGKELSFTCGALLAADSLPDDALASERLTSWTIVYVATQESTPISLIRSKEGILPAVLEWAQNIGESERENAVLVAREFLQNYRESACKYEIIGKKGKPTECGNAVCMAAFFMREYGMTFEEYCELPATRANALYAAWCESLGLDGVNTYERKEKARGLAEIMASMKFEA